jgi:uncharacterized SAM-binding protein YcdF (DUF218 family)
MLIAALLFLLIAALLLLLRKRSQAAILCLILSCLLLLLVGQGWLPNLLMRKLQSVPPLAEPEWKDRNAIVVLGVGAVRWPDGAFLTSHLLGFSRLYETLRLFRKCKQAGKLCSVLTSGGDPGKNGTSEAEVMKRELTEVGVPASDILIEKNSSNTFQNAQFASEILKHQHFGKVVLVTSGIHLRRSLMYFSHFDVKASGAPSDRLEPHLSLIPVSYNFSFTDLALHEYYGFLRYWFYNLVGWNGGSRGSSTAGTP